MVVSFKNKLLDKNGGIVKLVKLGYKLHYFYHKFEIMYEIYLLKVLIYDNNLKIYFI